MQMSKDYAVSKIGILYLALLFCAGSTTAGQTASPTPTAAPQTTQANPSATGSSMPGATEGPEVAPGIHLPATGIVWILDEKQADSALQRVRHSAGTINRHTGKNTARSLMFPFADQKMTMDIVHPDATVQIHTASPALFIYRTVREQEEIENGPGGKGNYSILHLARAGDHRVVCGFTMNPFGKPVRTFEAVESVVESVADAPDWTKIHLAKPLAPGHYAVVYLPPDNSQIDDYIYDFDIAAGATN